MLIRADVKCYYCGYVSGQIEGDPETTRPSWSFHSRGRASNGTRLSRRQIRCGRCGGPVYLDEIETVRSSYGAREPALAVADN
jgi:hypothetical protein